MKKRRILVVGAINRPDLLSMFDTARDAVELHFLEYRYNWGISVDERNYHPYGPVHYWSDFSSAGQLLDTVRPDAVALMFTSSFNQVALNMVARRRGLTTYHLEHGLRREYDPDDALWSLGRKTTFNWQKLRREWLVTLRNYAFLAGSMFDLSAKERADLARFVWESQRRPDFGRVLREFADLRRPSEYIAFSRSTMEFHAAVDGTPLDGSVPIHYVGVPYFDDLCGIRPQQVDPANVLLIDHQFHNAKIAGWTDEFRKQWVAELAAIIRELRLKLYVKLHPGDVSRAWEPYLGPDIRIIDLEELHALVPSTRTVTGIYSTLHMPLAALPHVALITLEIHPEPKTYSDSFVKAGVALPVTTFDEFRRTLARSREVAEEQAAHKARYIEQFLFRADGHARSRLRDILAAKPVQAL